MKKVFRSMTLIAIILAMCCCMFQGCSAKVNAKKVSDLVAIRVNNFMANWENEDFNFTYKGSSKLTVTVPYTNVLKITDLIVSPGSTAMVFSDSEYSIEVADKEKIMISNDFDGKGRGKAHNLYVRVQNDVKSKQYTDYSIEVRVSRLKTFQNTIQFQMRKEEILNNPDGNIIIPEDMNEIMLGQEKYVVIRNENDLMNEEYFTGGYNLIQGCDITITENYVAQENHTVRGKFYSRDIDKYDGNNYKVIYTKISSKYNGLLYYVNKEVKNVIAVGDNVDLGEGKKFFIIMFTPYIENTVNKIESYVNIDKIEVYAGIISRAASSNNTINYAPIPVGKSIKYAFGYGNGRGSKPPKVENFINVGSVVQSENLPLYGPLYVLPMFQYKDFALYKGETFGEIANCYNLGNMNYKVLEQETNKPMLSKKTKGLVVHDYKLETVKNTKNYTKQTIKSNKTNYIN